jgi:CheY-like chemotaxis protein
VTTQDANLDGTAPNPPVDAMTFDGIEVLVVEDHPANRFIIDSMLQRVGVRARMVYDGQAAVDLVEQGAAFDLILMDVEMPVLDGYGAAQAIRRLEAQGQVPVRHHIVALTANAFPSDREKALAAGMDDFIAKPIVLHQLKAVLARWRQLAGRV